MPGFEDYINLSNRSLCEEIVYSQYSIEDESNKLVGTFLFLISFSITFNISLV